MALSQDRGYVLNHLRAQYLAVVDDDQARRVIRPFPHHFRGHDTKDFNELLTRMDSPPIPIDVQEESELVERLKKAKNTINEESEDDDDDTHGEIHGNADQDLRKSGGLLDSLRSLATLKISDNKSPTVGSSYPELSPKPSSSSIPAATTKNGPAKRQQSISGKNVLSKLFRNSSSSSTVDRRSSASSTIRDDNFDGFDEEDEDDEDDEDDDDDDDEGDISTSTNDDPSSHAGNETNIELNENAETVPSEGGILVDQNYSDVNNTADNENKYIFGTSVSSGDDDMLLDSDFSDDDADVIDATFQSGSQTYSLSSRASSAATPSRSANRKLSFDKLVKPKLRRRAESLVTKKSSESGEPSHLSHSKSFSNVEELPLFGKVQVTAKPTQVSSLSALIGKKPNVEKKPSLEGFMFVSGIQMKDKTQVMKMNVWLPTEEKMTVEIRKTVQVFEAIGYILLNVAKEHGDLVEDERLLNPNRWCLRLADEDGEAFEGSFGLLDRTKRLDSFACDDVALCRVSDSDFEQNESLTPYTPSSNGRSGTPSPVKPQNAYYKSIIPSVENDVKDAKKVQVTVYEHPYKANAGNYTTHELLVSDHINDVLLKYTKQKGLDPNDYVLKPVNENLILDLNDDISTLDGTYKLEILTKRTARILKLKRRALFQDNTLPTINSNLTPQTLVVKPEFQPNPGPGNQQQQPVKSGIKKLSGSVPKVSSSFKVRNNSRNNSSLPAADSQFTSSGISGQYQKFTVWRRLPMSFINRHERTLAIDGEYVYIMPKDERNWYDTAASKTTTFHVSQIVNCKVSKRVPSNFKIVVMKANGPKRYMFEAMSHLESREIIETLKRLVSAYKINTQSVN
ncbi:CYFA0S01e16380g1_1 [Cyberlindnera fabianii]|uniref:CYFA0S01e16380g1_1 n=1 Tax=Cyberlindnera fabianii TaxID=36022 RepID=A0A061AKT2_CYBFA|nr:CYFA0S01e16380g1_1 [Cyberlindnera fabianii]